MQLSYVMWSRLCYLRSNNNKLISHSDLYTQPASTMDTLLSNIIKDSTRWSLSAGSTRPYHDRPVTASLLDWSWTSITGLVQTTRQVAVGWWCLPTSVIKWLSLLQQLGPVILSRCPPYSRHSTNQHCTATVVKERPNIFVTAMKDLKMSLQ